MRRMSVFLVGLAATGFVVTAGAPAEASDEPLYPVLCLHVVLPNGTPLPVVCLPSPI